MRKQMRQIIATTLMTAVLLGGCGSDKANVQNQKENESAQAVAEQDTESFESLSLDDAETEEKSTEPISSTDGLTEDSIQEADSEIESAENDNKKTITLTDGIEGEYGQYDLFDGEPYLRYYVPIGSYKVKCNVRGGFYIETIEIHKEDGWDTPDTIKQINMSAGDEVEISVEEGQCISLYLRTEIELVPNEESKKNNSNAYQKGQELGDKINEKLESIDWEENYEKADEAGKKAAEWLNGLFE